MRNAFSPIREARYTHKPPCRKNCIHLLDTIIFLKNKARREQSFSTRYGEQLSEFSACPLGGAMATENCTTGIGMYFYGIV